MKNIKPKGFVRSEKSKCGCSAISCKPCMLMLGIVAVILIGKIILGY